METREAWLNDAVQLLATEYPELQNLPRIRITAGYPSGKRSGDGYIADPKASTDGTTELFIGQHLDTSTEVLKVLLHQCISLTSLAFLSNGYLSPSKFDSTPALDASLIELADMMPVYPHAKLSIDAVKRDVNRQLAVRCTDTADCGFKCRMSRKWLDKLHYDALCPVCNESPLEESPPAK